MRDGRRTSYCKFLHTEVTAVAKTGSDPFSPLITKVVRSLLFLFFPRLLYRFFFLFFFVLVWTFKLHFCRLRMTHSGRMAGVSGPGLRSLIAFPLLFANDSNDQDPPRWPILHGGGKITAGSTCSVLLRRNYFPNSICSKFGGPLRIFHESFPKRNTLSNGCNQ